MKDKLIKTRKSHVCEVCGKPIPAGSLASREEFVDFSRSFTGRVYVGYTHRACHKEVSR